MENEGLRDLAASNHMSRTFVGASVLGSTAINDNYKYVFPLSLPPDRVEDEINKIFMNPSNGDPHLDLMENALMKML